ncbi:MAG: Zn-ribbon domain-containing OB-fold protein [Acidilobaceae archaeon]
MRSIRLPGMYLREEDLRKLVGVIEYTPRARYSYSAGQALSEFLRGLREGRILGRLCPSCNRVLVPPRVYCEHCYTQTTEWVEVPGTGRVESVVVSYIGTARERLEKPEIIAVIRLDAPGYGRDSFDFAGLFHKLCGVTEDDVKSGRVIGLRVKPRWKPLELRTGSILDIECFEPEVVESERA